MNILITGGTGLIGKEIGKRLVFEGHKLWLISRSGDSAKAKIPFPCEVIQGDISIGPVEIPQAAKLDAVIHLAGESIMGRWNEDKKDAIWDSRVNGTQHLIESLSEAKNLKAFIAASAIGLYGDRGDEELTEESSSGDGFLAAVTKNWEESIFSLKHKAHFENTRVVAVRTPLVLSRMGGALDLLTPVFQNHLGAPLGSGQQWMSWIHLDDLVGVYVQALSDSHFEGPVNAVAPEGLRNKEFTKVFARSLGHKSLPLNVPSVGLELVFGEMKEVVLSSQRVINSKLKDIGFEYRFAKLEQALDNLLVAQREGDMELYQEQFVPASIDEVFSFFSNEQNLEKITPPTMSFQVLSKSTDAISEGTEINYKLKVHGIPLKWTSVIEKWNPSKGFIDRQLKGPYKKWVHVHHFEEMPGGVLMTDYVRYKLPAGFLGRTFGSPLVSRDLKNIFSYRREYISREFQKN